MMKILVLGVGNILLQDEGLGVHAIERLQQRYQIPDDVDVIDGGTMGLDLINFLEGVTHLLVTDAVEANQPPGSLVRLANEEIPVFLSHKISPHQVGLSDILSVARLRDMLPEQMLLLGMQPASFATGLELSPIVESQLDLLVAEVVQALNAWGVLLEEV